MKQSDSSEIDSSLFMAQISLNSGRSEDAIKYLKEHFQKKPNLTRSERDLLSHAYRLRINSSREALRKINSQISIETQENNQVLLLKLKNLQGSLLKEFNSIATDVIDLVENVLLPAAIDVPSVVFLNKFKGDYFRYSAEFSTGESLEMNINSTKICYETAMRSVGDDIKLSDPLYLGLALNYSVFQYEILNLRDEAIEKADSTFNEAVRYLEELDENDYKEATTLLQLLRDNVSIWKEAKAEEVEKGGQSK